MLKVNLEDVKKAEEVLKSIVKETPLQESKELSAKLGANVYYKCENLQKTGAFKIRGAYNKIMKLDDEAKKKGLIASSAGNHAQGVALGAKMTGINATIVMPATAPLAKVTATKGYGAEVVLNGEVYDDAYAKAVEIQKETGATFLHPFDDEYVIAGQGTIGLEIFKQLNENVDTILCPIGGGGIIAGIAVAAKGLNPNVKIIGVQTSNIPSMKVSKENGKVTTAFNGATIADGIAVKTPGNTTFEIINELVDEVITVSEEEIAQGMLFLMEHQKVVAEGAGAVTTAALLSGKYKPQKDENVVCVISGGNVDVNTLYRVIGVGLAAEGRRYSFSATMTDKPGGFLELISIISKSNANQRTVDDNMVVRVSINELNKYLSKKGVISKSNNPEKISKMIAYLCFLGFINKCSLDNISEYTKAFYDNARKKDEEGKAKENNKKIKTNEMLILMIPDYNQELFSDISGMSSFIIQYKFKSTAISQRCVAALTTNEASLKQVYPEYDKKTLKYLEISTIYDEYKLVLNKMKNEIKEKGYILKTDVDVYLKKEDDYNCMIQLLMQEKIEIKNVHNYIKSIYPELRELKGPNSYIFM